MGETTIGKVLQQILPENQLQEKEVIDLSGNSLPNEFPDIHPTEEDFYLGKLHAYRLAANRKAVEEKNKKEKERLEQFTRMWTPDEMKVKAIKLGKAIGIQEGFDFVIDKDNQHAFDLLCLYFTNDPKFETFGIGDRKYSLNKGIWLQSPTRGTGKTVLLRCFYINKRACFGYFHTKQLAVMFQKGGYGAIDPFLQPLPQSPSALNFYQTDAGMMYDEMFSGEDKVNHMGSPLFISEYIINSLYDFSNAKNKNQKWKFHCTSNSSGDDIERLSSMNFRSRMADMFNLIKLEGKDRRLR